MKHEDVRVRREGEEKGQRRMMPSIGPEGCCKVSKSHSLKAKRSKLRTATIEQTLG